MTLLELMVKELPKRGGWPEGMVCATKPHWGNEIYFYSKNYTDGQVAQGRAEFSFYADSALSVISSGLTYLYVTREQYEAALAASKHPVWNGEGLPPVGVECEYTLNSGGTWWKCTIKYIVGTSGIVMACDCTGGEQYVDFKRYNSNKEQFKLRPIRTEAERKREEAVSAMISIIYGPKKLNFHEMAEIYYDAIACGKIPGVQLTK